MDDRLAPEDPWPAAPNDCEAAALWLLAHAGPGSARRAVLDRDGWLADRLRGP